MKFIFTKKNINRNNGRGFPCSRFWLRNSVVKATKPKFTTGFTLLEVLIAIAILSFAVATTFTATQAGLSSAIESKNQVIGYYLAQEAVEFIRNKRDENSLNGAPWLSGIAENSSDPCYFGKMCLVDILDSSLTSCSTPTTCPYLKQVTLQTHPAYGMYGYGSGFSWGALVNTSFKREISLTSINSNEVLVKVDITWSKGSFSRTFTVRESLFNWQ